MNGYRGNPGGPMHNFQQHDPISPASLDVPTPNWEHKSSISNTLDSIIIQYLADPSPTQKSPEVFAKFPPEVIVRILWAVDADGFASLTLLNRAFYKASQNLELYAHHLSRCPSFALSNNVITGPFRKNDLYRLKTKFAAEVRRNLFNAYVRPRETHINLISVNANSSAAFPGGEAFRFEFSPNGRTILALSSSRIYVLDATRDNLEVIRELKTLRRPLAASVTDDGSLLAVLSSKYQANIYGITERSGVKHLQVIVLDNPPRTIALAHEGTVLAAAYEGGIEVFSLAINALSTDRRAVRSEAVDNLTFSSDGSMLVGSSQDLEEPNAVVITAPFYTENDPNITPREIHSRMWTTQILFPQISSTVSHAALLPGHTEGDTNWLFAYDHMLTTYRAVRTDDTRTGVAYFLSPPGPDRFEYPSPSIAPTLTSDGTLAIAGFDDKGLYLYGIPERLDVCPDMGSVIERNDARLHGRGNLALTSATGHTEPLLAYSPSASGSSDDIEEDGLAGKVDWRQSLFVKCRPIRSIPGITAAKWVENSEDDPCVFPGKRLISTAPGGLGNHSEDLGEENMPVDGSRICLLDFDYGPGQGTVRELTIEVGDNEPELLTEQIGNIEVEVAMERRRTVRAARGRPPNSRAQLSRAVTAASPTTHPQDIRNTTRRNSVSHASSTGDGPLSPITPATLSRSQTAAGFHNPRFPPRPPLGQQAYEGPMPGGGHRNAHGHRGSVDSWETPPPPYGGDIAAHKVMNQSNVRHPPIPLPMQYPPGHYRQSILNGATPNLRPFPPAAVPNVMVGGPTFRQSTTLDGMMTSEAAPSQGQEQIAAALSRAARPWAGFDHGLETVQEQHLHPTVSRDTSDGPQSTQFRGNGTDVSPDEGYPTQSTLGLRPTLTHPMSPPTPDRQTWLERIPDSAIMPEHPEEHEPGTPVAVGQIAAATGIKPQQSRPPIDMTFPGPSLNMAQAGLTQEHPAHQRFYSAGSGILQPGHNHQPSYASHHYNLSSGRPTTPNTSWNTQPQLSPPNHGQPATNLAPLHLGPDHIRSQSRSSHVSMTMSLQGSMSTPNLLQFPQANNASSSRLNMISSANQPYMNGRTHGHDRERSHSVSMGDARAASRADTEPLTDARGKKGKKKKEDKEGEGGKKKGMKCTVM